MKILILNGSPRKNGNTSALAHAFAEGARTKGHDVTLLQVGAMKIAGCLGCEYCHSHDGVCVQKDDMAQIYAALKDADMLVIASPINYFTFSAQMQCAIQRTYAVGIPKALRLSALLLSSGSDDVYEAAVKQYHMVFQDYMEFRDAGIITAHGAENKSAAKLAEARELGRSV
jgi:multimeric flavodoxin WrbA